MKMAGDKGRFSWKWFIILGVLAIVVYLQWFFFFSYGECETWSCFNENLAECDRVKFIGGSGTIFEYTILGRSRGSCSVNVELLQGELNNQDSIRLEGDGMICDLPDGVVMVPESDIGNCHGPLKEGLQELIIKKLHTYLVQNLGRINLEVLDAPVV